MATDLETGFTPPGDEKPSKYHVHEMRISNAPDGGASFSMTWSYGKDDGEGNYVRIGRLRTASWSGADVVAIVSTPDPGAVHTDLHSIARQLLLDGGYIAEP